jgi:MOSC domain-containing protein YiiM
MDPAEHATAVAGQGLEGDANYGRSRRQVTIIEKEVFDRIGEVLPGARPLMRRANFMVSGVQLRDTRDRVLSLGDVRVHVQGETRPCERMDEQCPGLTGALAEDWNGGVYGIVLDAGEIRVGDPVSVEGMIGESGSRATG